MNQALEGRGFVLRRRGAPETGVPQVRGFGWLAVKIWKLPMGKWWKNQQFPMGKWKTNSFLRENDLQMLFNIYVTGGYPLGNLTSLQKKTC